MNLRALSAIVTLTLVAAVPCAAGFGCSASEQSPSPSPGEQTGTLSAALTAVGPDGATYSLPLSTNLMIYTAPTDGGVSTFMAQLGLSGGGATQSFSVGSGSYTATLFSNYGGLPPDAGTPWTLTRNGDGGATSVQAVLTDPQPYTFTINAGQITNVTFHFTVLGLGSLTFSTGTLTTGVQVVSGTTTPGHIVVTGNALMYPPGSGQLNLTPAVNSLLTYTGNPSVSYAENLTITGPFVPNVDAVCAPVSGTVTATGSADAGATGTDLADLFIESSNGTGTVCLSDANNGNAGMVSVSLVRIGGATTAPFSNALNGSGAPDGGGVQEDFQFTTGLIPPTPLYNGTTATFPTTTATNGFVSDIIFPIGGSGFASVSGNGATTIQFTP
jgi:hypothetical protein